MLHSGDLFLSNLQQSGQFGLSVGNVARLVSREGLDDLAQAGEGQVDALALSEGVPGVGADTSLPWDISQSVSQSEISQHSTSEIKSEIYIKTLHCHWLLLLYCYCYWLDQDTLYTIYAIIILY